MKLVVALLYYCMEVIVALLSHLDFSIPEDPHFNILKFGNFCVSLLLG